eukprot:TRINITY_DN79018_c0_g1_i1.p1 TRINITY_DN79018_c0_g1~~TRINITY_DN79018_c0_g1_i1.p1  ORF type:complete len:892 (-),score=180.87 TRINITY_DN79018_c0_g1_i1:64-2739(-)
MADDDANLDEADPGDIGGDLGDEGGLGDFGDDYGEADDLGDMPEDEEEQEKKEDPDEPPEITGVTRLQMLEYMNQRAWWKDSQARLFFTALLWITFAYLALYRSEVTSANRVQDALVGYVGRIQSHPAISGVKLRTPGESSMACRCGCRHIGGFPVNSCDLDGQTEPFDFFGRIGAADAERIVEANGGFYPPGAQDMDPMSWDKINTAEDVMLWIEHGFLPDVWGTVAAKVIRRPGLILNRNLVIGGVRARQIRAETSLENCDLQAGLISWFSIPCRNSVLASGAFGPAASGNITEVTSMPTGAFEAYSPSRTSADGSGAYDALFDVERPLFDPLTTATYLRRHGWMTDATKSLALHCLMLNAESGAFALLKITFDFGYDGVVDKSVKTSVFRTPPAATSVLYWLPEIFWLILICLMVWEELKSFVKLARAREVGKYFKDFWNIVDWISIAVGAALVVYSFWIDSLTAELSKNVAALPRAPLSEDLDRAAYRDRWSQNIDDAEYIHFLIGYRQLCLFWYSSIITLRFLKGFLGQAKLAMLQLTFATGFWDVLHFMLMWLVFLNNFAVGGKILFGAELTDWSTYPRSIATCIRVLMGSPQFDRMYEIGPVSATIWYWSFILSMTFLMLNLLYVIIVYHFSQTRKAVGKTAGILSDLKQSWKDFLWRMDWRKDQFSEGEYKACFLGDPYAELVEGLIENAKIDDEMQTAATQSCLGIRLRRKMMEDLSIDGLSAETNPAYVFVQSLELRKIACDALTAEHLLEECNNFVAGETSTNHLNQLSQVRSFVTLLRRSREALDKHCTMLEEGIEEDQEELELSLERLEGSVESALYGFQALAGEGIDSLAPPPLGQGGEMKAQLPAMLETVRAQNPDLRSTAGFGGGDYPALPNGTM